jgi:hypothetical protein
MLLANSYAAQNGDVMAQAEVTKSNFRRPHIAYSA